MSSATQSVAGEKNLSQSERTLHSPGYNPPSIPKELLGRERWVVWEYQGQGGHRHKVPVDRTGAVDASAPENQRTFAEAFDTFQSKYYPPDGLGFHLSGTPFVCVDIDDCRDPSTGEVEGWASTIVTELDSYSEVSPSGRGIHIWIEGSVPERFGVRSDGIEVYDDNQFITVTRDHLAGTPEMIEARQDALTSVCEAYLGTREVSIPEAPEPLTTQTEASHGDGELTNELGIPLGALADEYDRLNSYLTDDIPSVENFGNITKADGSPDWSRFDYRLACSLRFHHFTSGQIEDILREYRGPLRPDDKLGRTDYVSLTVRQATSAAGWRANYGDTFADDYGVSMTRREERINPITVESATNAKTPRSEYESTLRETMRQVLADETPAIVDAPPALGKTRGIVSAAKDTGTPVTVFVARNENKSEVAKSCEDAGLNVDEYYTLPSVFRDCPAAPEDPQSAETGEEKEIAKLHAKGATGYELHNELNLSCSEGDKVCPYIDKHPDAPEDHDVLIAHYSYAYNHRYTRNRTCVFDEDTGSTFRETFAAGDVAEYVNTYLSSTDGIPFADGADLVANEHAEDRIEETREWFRSNPPERDGSHVIQTGGRGHALAPLLTYRMFFVETLENGWKHTDLGAGRHSATSPEDNSVTLLLPPDLSAAINTVALEAEPCEGIWRSHVNPDLRVVEVLTPEEKRDYVRNTQHVTVVPVKTPGDPRYSVSGGNPEIIQPETDARILRYIGESEGEKPTMITGKKAIEKRYRPAESDVLGAVEQYEWYGNTRGSNKFRNVEVGAVVGSPHYGDRYIQLLGALLGKDIEQVGENRANALEYRNRADESDTYGNDVYKHMTESSVLQAVMRFGRDGDETHVYVRTRVLPEWVETNDPLTVETVNSTEAQILDILESGPDVWYGTPEVSDRIVSASRKSVERVLSDLADTGLVERKDRPGGESEWRRNE